MICSFSSFLIVEMFEGGQCHNVGHWQGMHKKPECITTMSMIVVCISKKKQPYDAGQFKFSQKYYISSESEYGKNNEYEKLICNFQQLHLIKYNLITDFFPFNHNKSNVGTGYKEEKHYLAVFQNYIS